MNATIIKTGCVLSVFLLVMIQCKETKVPQLGIDPVRDVIAAMTLEEKVYFVTGTGMALPGIILPAEDTIPTPGAPVAGDVQNLVPGAAGTTYAIPRLGIPAMVIADGPAGLRISPTRENDSATFYCTAFPVGTLLASTWDTLLVHNVGKAMGNEALEYGADIILGPGMNIQRNPLCGRNFEYYSEDPFLSGNLAASMVNGIESEGVGASLKHLVANNTETNRNALNTIVSERALREIYLEGFRIAVEKSRPWSVMSAYNLVNDTMTSQSNGLLTKILRDDWGFKGFVMTDWFGGNDPVAQMKAGNDLLMPGTPQQAKAIHTAVREGRLKVAILDRNIERMLNIILKTPRFRQHNYSKRPDLQDHAVLARKAAAEGMILLKNTGNTLPLSSKTSLIAAFGNTSYDMITGGSGSGDVNEAYSISLVEGLKGAGYRVHEQLLNSYIGYIGEAKLNMPLAMPFMPPALIAEMPVDYSLASKIASETDAALLTIGRNSGELIDRVEAGDFNLKWEERELIKTVCRAFHAKKKPVIVLLNVAGVIEVATWRDMPDAILLVWEAGQETGNAIADILSGKVNPSGKLATTFPVKYMEVPSSLNFPGSPTESADSEEQTPAGVGLASFIRPQPSKIIYAEGIYVGYRYFETFKVQPAYEFGYGLSFTTFEYSNLTLNSQTFTGRITVTVDVKNTGSMAGKEVVQLYLSAPAVKLDKPAMELKGFAKTILLLPGETQTLSFNILPRQLCSFDTETSSWKGEAGFYHVKIGASSRDIRLNGSFELPKGMTLKKENAVLVPQETINELKPEK